MNTQVIQTTFMSLGIGFLCELTNIWFGTLFLQEFLEKNLVTILVALLAINATTMGIVLTKIRDLIDKSGTGANFFKSTRFQMMLSIKEQIFLIILGVTILTIKDSNKLCSIQHSELLLNSITISIFSYALFVLYDTAKSVLIIVDYES